MTTGLGAIEMLFLLFFGGQTADLASLLSPQDYFKAHQIEITTDKMVELAAKDPVDGSSQLAQLLALRTLGEGDAFKKAVNYGTQRKVLEEIAAGRKAQDKLGFAEEYAQRTLAHVDGSKPPTPAALGARADGLAWYPATATFVAGFEYRPSPQPGRPTSAAMELLLKMPPEIKKQFYKFVDSLGNVEIKRITFAFVDEGNGNGRNFARLTGRFNPAWVSDFLTKTAGVAVTEKKERAGKIIITRTGKGPAIALVGEQDFLVAGFSRSGQDEEVLEQALAMRDKEQTNAATGGLKATLDKIPAQAIGYLVGEFPPEVRRNMMQPLGAFPNKVFAHMERIAGGVDFIIQGGMGDEDQAKTFVKTTSKLRQDALDALQKAPEVPVPGINLAELKKMLNSLQLEAKGAGVNVRVLLTDEGMKAIPLYFMVGSDRQGGPPAVPQEVPPQKNEN